MLFDMAISRTDLLAFMREERYAVQASTSPKGDPEAAIIGIVVSDRFEVFFDTLDTTRKAKNLRSNSRLAFVIGPTAAGSERTVQYEGVADEPVGSELERLLDLYFRTFPDGPSRRSWPGLIYVRVKPTWIRFSDFASDPPEIVEFRSEDLDNRNR